MYILKLVGYFTLMCIKCMDVLVCSQRRPRTMHAWARVIILLLLTGLMVKANIWSLYLSNSNVPIEYFNFLTIFQKTIWIYSSYINYIILL